MSEPICKTCNDQGQLPPPPPDYMDGFEDCPDCVDSYIAWLETQLRRAADVLCPAIEGNTEDREADLSSGYGILREATERLPKGAIVHG